jgi:phage major head subunit gpT-like protein
MPTISGFPDILTPGFKKIFNDGMARYAETDKIARLFNMQTSPYSDEKFSSIGAMGDLKRLDMVGAVQYDSPVQGYDVTIDFPEYVSGFTVQRKLYDDDRYSVMNAQPQKLALAAYRTRQAYAASVFNNAFATTWTKDGFVLKTTGGDGVALCSDSHTFTTGLNGSSTPTAVVDNNQALALSATNIDTVRQAMKAYTDDRGNLLMVNPDTILIPPELEKTMWEIGGSEKVPGEFSNTANFMYNRFQVVVWDLLTDANAWFMIDSQLMKQHLHWFDRVPAELGEASDFDKVSAKWRVYARWGYGFSDWRWIYGCNAS